MGRIRRLGDGTLVRGERVALSFACIAALLVVAELLRAFAGRLFYQTDAEFMEGGTLLAAYRLIHHLPVYTTPGSGFMPFVYTPLVTALLAGLGEIFGLSFTLGRAVSIFAVLVASALLARAVHARSGGQPFAWGWPVVSLGFVAAGYPVTGGAYDLVRVDSVALAFAVGAATVAAAALERPSRSRWILLTLLLVGCVYTKQNHVAFVIWILLFVAMKRPRTAGAVTLSFGGLSLLLLVALEWGTHGNFWYYTGKTVSEHAVLPRNALGAAGILVRFAPYAPAVFVAALVLAVQRRLDRRSLLWVGMFACSLAVALITYAKVGASINNFISAVVLAGPAALCVFGDVLRAVPSVRRRSAVAAAGALAAAAYLLARSFDPTPYMANAERMLAVKATRAFVSKLRGGVLFPMRPFTAISSGQPMEQIHAASWFDYSFTPEGRPLFGTFLERLRPAWIILTGEEPAVVVAGMQQAYFLRGYSPEATWKADVLPYGTNHPIFVFGRDMPDPPHTRCLFDFESGTYDGWRVEGSAFGKSPARFRESSGQGAKYLLGVQGVVVGAEGNFVASSGATPEGDAAVGAIESPEFVLDGNILRLRVGGGNTDAERVELRVNGVVRQVVFGHGASYLMDVGWDVESDRGRRATLRVVDEGTGRGARILLDSVRLVGSDGSEGWCKRAP